MRTFLILSIILITSIVSNGQYKPKEIKTKKDYIQKSTNLVFPLKIDNYSRERITKFDKKATNIGVSYQNIDSKGKTTVTIYVYHAWLATENRFRNEFLGCLKSALNNSDKKDVDPKLTPVSYKNSGYKVNGFKAEMSMYNAKSNLYLYECGQWFFKIRITSENLDSLGFVNLENKILDYFIPTNIVTITPLNTKTKLVLNKDLFLQDNSMFTFAMSCAAGKLLFLNDKVDSLEKFSGFPGLYLDYYVSSLKGVIEVENKKPVSNKTKQATDYINDLNTIVNSPFLNEFVMEQYNMIMIVPQDTKLDFEGYKIWKKSNPININLKDNYYKISYE